MNDILYSFIFEHMKNQELHCLIIRGQVGRYPALVQDLSKLSHKIKINLIDNDAAKVQQVFLGTPLGLVFLFKDSGISVEVIAEMMRKTSSEAILVSLNDEKPQSALAVKAGYTGVQVCNLHYHPAGPASNLSLKFLTQYAFLKTEFRNCKSLLRVSEQRCHWLVDSSSEAVAYISDDLHLYANNTYIELFDHDSLHSLKVTDVSSLVVEDERNIFLDFLKQHENRSATASALVVTLQPCSGERFRASIRLIPTVFCGTRCLQLWVRKLGRGRLPTISKDDTHEEPLSIEQDLLQCEDDDRISIVENSVTSDTSIKRTSSLKPKSNFSTLGRKPQRLPIQSSRQSMPRREIMPMTSDNVLKRPVIYNKLLKQVILNNEVVLNISKLDPLKKSSSRQYMVDLDVSENIYNGVGNMLEKRFHEVFWDQVMLVLLFQQLKQVGNKAIKLIIPLTEASVKDALFKRWLKSAMFRLEYTMSDCIFLLSLASDGSITEQEIKVLAGEIRQHQCKVGIDNFKINCYSRFLLETTKPEFVRFSKEWIMASVKNKEQAAKLSKSIKMLEKNNVKVIAPYNAGKQMKMLFDISGASFYQKQAVS